MADHTNKGAAGGAHGAHGGHGGAHSGHGGSGKFFAKGLKQLSRTKAKVLQNLGKAEKTTDEVFDEHVNNFFKQQDLLHRLQKQMKNYIMCAKGMALASKSLFDTIQETYEPCFTEAQQFQQSITSVELMWNDYLARLENQVSTDISHHMIVYPDFKLKIAKRGRKLVDYDNARHSLEALQGAKKRDDVKISKSAEEQREAKKVYEELNNELTIDLPALYDGRGAFYGQLYQDVFDTENVFHDNVGKLCLNLVSVASQLYDETKSQIFIPKLPLEHTISEPVPTRLTNGEHTQKDPPRTTSDTRAMSDTRATSDTRAMSDTPSKFYTSQPGDTSGIDLSMVVDESHDLASCRESVHSNKGETEPATDRASQHKDSSPGPSPRDSEHATAVPSSLPAESEQAPALPGSPPPPLSPGVYENVETDNVPATEPQPDNNNVPDEKPVVVTPPVSTPPAVAEKPEKIEVPAADPSVYENTVEVLKPPPGTLYMVEATHTYKREDPDELSFQMGDVIYVIPFDNLDEQDDGWQMGVKKCDGTIGVFPENFSRRLTET